jgi:hypothetical protein
MNWRELLQEAISENPLTKAHGQAISSQTQPTNTGATVNAGSRQEATTNLPETRHPALGPARAMSWVEWKADALNTLFQQYGSSGQRGRITPATVLHGESQANPNTPSSPDIKA